MSEQRTLTPKIRELSLTELEPYVDTLMKSMVDIVPFEKLPGGAEIIPEDIWFKRTFTMLMGSIIAAKAHGMQLDWIQHNVKVVFDAIMSSEFQEVPFGDDDKKGMN